MSYGKISVNWGNVEENLLILTFDGNVICYYADSIHELRELLSQKQHPVDIFFDFQPMNQFQYHILNLFYVNMVCKLLNTRWIVVISHYSHVLYSDQYQRNILKSDNVFCVCNSDEAYALLKQKVTEPQ